MPIEIKELHIKINVADDQPQSTEPSQIKKEMKDKIIAECVEQVMDILAKNQER
ncbi:MAG: hypothetical protein JXR61_05330 [Prolixibacteraceae bacterium]|nr:hypothetical protein [Prolixibacteraceae bacterium]